MLTTFSLSFLEDPACCSSPHGMGTCCCSCCPCFGSMLPAETPIRPCNEPSLLYALAPRATAARTGGVTVPGVTVMGVSTPRAGLPAVLPPGADARKPVEVAGGAVGGAVTSGLTTSGPSRCAPAISPKGVADAADAAAAASPVSPAEAVGTAACVCEAALLLHAASAPSSILSVPPSLCSSSLSPGCSASATTTSMLSSTR